MTRRLQAVAFVAGVAFLAWLVVTTGPRTILRDLARTGWTFLPIVLVWGGVYAGNTVAWLALLQGAAADDHVSTGGAVNAEEARGVIPFPRAFAITVSAFALNYVTPFVSLGGEPFKGAAAARWVGRPRAAASVVSFRVVHSLGQFLFWALTIPVAWVVLPPDRATRTLLLVAAVVLIPASVGAVFLLRARVLERGLDALRRARALGGLGTRLSARLEPRRAALAAVDAELVTVARHPAPLALALAVEVAGRFLAAFELVLVARVVGAPFGYADAVVAAGVSQVIMNLLFFVPFEAGTREGGLVLVARLLGLAPTVAVYAALVTRLRELTWIGIGLGLIWAAGERGGGDGGTVRGRAADDGAAPGVGRRAGP
ncbi:membrane protein [Gemmatimonadetes bacterium T265]|nr:membrane protein [Gemmatimonadetes bacterium T265]